jgi:hypothetical protein
MEINKNTAKLTKNPLGIISLFILLTYGMASFLFGFVNNNISESQKWFFIYFITIFPVIVLFLFFILVIKYHTHLYSPGEFRDEENFVGITEKKREERKIEVEEIIELERNNNSGGVQNNTNESKIVMNQYIKAETLVLDKLAKERNALIRRDIALDNKDLGIRFDGLLEDDKTLTFVEIKYTRRSFIPLSTVETISYRAIQIKNLINKGKLKTAKDINVILIFVIDSNDFNMKQLQIKLDEYKKVLSNPPLDILIYKMDELE